MAKQGILPGTLSKRSQEIEEAAETYLDHMDKRLSALKKEVTSKTALIEVMKRLKRKSYRRGKYAVTLISKSTADVKVERVQEGEDDDGAKRSRKGLEAVQ